MKRLSFYFDPLCPWCWLTSLWARDLQRQGAVEIDWKFFSLASVNGYGEERNGPLRVAALARREGGNDAVERAYLALGRLIHEQKMDTKSEAALRQQGPAALESVGLSGDLVARALEDPTTLKEVCAEHDDAVTRFGAFGVPWLVLEGEEFGFFGPVVGKILAGQEALELWEHTRWMLQQPCLYELKRENRDLPQLKPGDS